MPVFIAANVLVDLEVLADQYLQPGWPVHQLWHFHTLLIGGVAGAVFGAIIHYLKPLRWLSEKSMSIIGLRAKSTLLSMILAGILGVWLHVFIDSVYHYDVQIFWPFRKNPLYWWVTRSMGYSQGTVQEWVRWVCLGCWVLGGLLYGALWVRKVKTGKTRSLSRND